jgi:hypothetical protein
MKRVLLSAAAVIALAMPAVAAAEKTMPIDFVGDWCSPSRDKNTTWYTLPSWTEGGHCTDILSINKYGFYYANWHCEPVNMRLEKDVVSSGIGYTAKVNARCQPDGPVTAGKFQTFEFWRYMSVTTTEPGR